MNNERTVPRIEPDECRLPNGEVLSIHLFRPEDSPGIGKLFRTVYGENYPVKHFYSPEGLARALESGENYSVVARTKAGDIIGHVALCRSSPYPGLYECGAGLVLPEYRNGGVSLVMMEHLYERLTPGLGLEAVWGEAVCNHVFMQKICKHHKHVETGLEVNLMPAETYAKEKSSSGRVASLVVFRSYVSRPHTVYLPQVYENVLRFIYSGMDDRRTLAISCEKPPVDAASYASTEIYDFPGVARIAVRTLGEDFGSHFHSLENKILTKRIKVVQVSIDLGCPWSGHAVEVLRARGYFLGGVLPRWFGNDALLMQKIVGRPGWDGIHLFSEGAVEMLGIIKNDWQEVTRS